MHIAVEINSIEELQELVGFGRKLLVADEVETFDPEDSDEEICGEDDYDTAGRARLVGSDADWARLRELAGLEGERAGQAVGAPNKKEYYIAPSKVADIDVYIRIANELGEFGPKFFRDRWQEIKAMYQTYRDEGVPGRNTRNAPTSFDVAGLKDVLKNVESIKVEDVVSECNDEPTTYSLT